MELLEHAYADTPRSMWVYAERSLLAHLVKLEREGLAVREGGGWRRHGGLGMGGRVSDGGGHGGGGGGPKPRG